MGARDVLGRNELDRINEKSIDLNGYFGSVWSGLDLVLAVTPSAIFKEKAQAVTRLGFFAPVIFSIPLGMPLSVGWYGVLLYLVGQSGQRS